jgi:magnesium dechelatase
LSRLLPYKLHSKYLDGMPKDVAVLPRYYTLTHSDATGDLFLSIGKEYNKRQTASLYTRLMRDEVTAELIELEGNMVLNVHCHVSGGIVFGLASWRYKIFCSELPLVFEALRLGDKDIFDHHKELDQAKIVVHFKSHARCYNITEPWGKICDYSQEN